MSYKKLVIAAFFALIGTFGLSGCGSVKPISLDEQLPRPEYSSGQVVMIEVSDQRTRVKEGKPVTFVGVAHGAFGIPQDVQLHALFAGQPSEPEPYALAQFLQKRLGQGFDANNWDTKPSFADGVESGAQSPENFEGSGAGRFLRVILKEWYFSINLSWVTAFNFDTEVDVEVYDSIKGKIFEKNIKERDVVDVSASDSYGNLILKAYRDQLSQIINDPDVRDAITR